MMSSNSFLFFFFTISTLFLLSLSSLVALPPPSLSKLRKEVPMEKEENNHKGTTEVEVQEPNKKEMKEMKENTLSGGELLAGIRDIIGRDGLLSEGDLQYKPFMGSFANVKSDSDALLPSTSYCMTDNHCGHMEAYSESTVPLEQLACNKFCYIDKDTNYYATSSVYTIDNPPDSYLCCGWETCG